MKITNSFNVPAPPDQVFAYLLDVNKVVSCVPGAELDQIVDSSTFSGKLKVKAGAVSITYQGTAQVVNTEESDNRATVTVDAKGKEVGGSGLVFAKVLMTVAGTASGGSEVSIDADVTIAGKLAQFGRGVVEDMSRTMVGQMAGCISAQLQGGGGGGGGAPAPAKTSRWGRR
jgi:carbon monoxide dehydrogenase subunit G